MKRNIIENTLLKIGIPAGVKGFRYITDAILIADENPNCDMTNVLYPSVAEKNETTAIRVERAIRHAFGLARKYGDKNAVEHYIGLINCTNSSSIRMLQTRIRHECDGRKEDDSDRAEIPEALIRRIVREELKVIMGGIA